MNKCFVVGVLIQILSVLVSLKKKKKNRQGQSNQK